jgi:GTPase
VTRQLIEIQSPVERAFLVGAPRKGSDDAAHVDEHLDELARLADTAGAEVIGRTFQRIDAPSPNFYLGQGKVEELKGVLSDARATLVLVDEPLTPVQGVNLEKHLDARVMDRTEVILDIFATRARSHEAKLQVELAQLEYLLPRLTRMWTHLSRIRGGIGLRGPGETQLETDRRAIRRKIGLLKKRLDDVADHRANQRQGRRALPTAALVGYTNTGKSSLLKALSGDDVFVEDRLFATLDPLVRRCEAPGGVAFLLIDTVGFIRKLPHHLVASFRSTLEEAVDADLLLHVVDASSPALEDHLATTRQTLESLGLAEGRMLLVLNKCDRVPPATVELLRAAHPGALALSALRAEDGARLRDAIVAALGTVSLEETVALAVDEVDVLAELFRLVRVTGTSVSDGHIEVRFRSRPEDRERVARLLGGARGRATRTRRPAAQRGSAP